jgi:hypothetical protein
LRRPDSNRRYAAYETAAIPLGYSAVDGENWHGVPVLPRTRKDLETSLRKLTPAVWCDEKWSGQPDLHRHSLIGSQESCCWKMTAL